MTSARANKSVRNSFGWAGSEAILGLALSMGSLLGIARLIGVEEFGLASLALAFVQIMSLALNALLHDAIVQRSRLDANDRASAVAGAVAFGVGGMLLILAVSPILGRAYGEPRLAWLTAAMAPMILGESVSAVLLAFRRRALNFRLVSIASLGGKALGVAAGVSAAILGFGAWAIPIQMTVAAAGMFLILAGSLRECRGGWPSWPLLRDMLRFTQPIVATQILLHGSERLLVAFVGYAFGVQAAAYWSLASRVVDTIGYASLSSLYHVALAYYSRCQDDRHLLQQRLLLWQSWVAAASTLVVVMVFVCADPFVRYAVGSEWLPAVPIAWVMLINVLFLTRRILPSVALTAVGLPKVPFTAYAAENLLALLLILVIMPETVIGLALIRLARGVFGYLYVIRAVGTQLRFSQAMELAELVLMLVICAAAITASSVVRIWLPSPDLLTQSAGIVAALACCLAFAHASAEDIRGQMRGLQG